MNKTHNGKYVELIDHVNRLENYLKESWKYDEAPTILQAKYEMDYDMCFELNLYLTEELEDPFGDALCYLIEHGDAMINIDIRNEIRIYDPKELFYRKMTITLANFLKAKWKSDNFPRFFQVWREFNNKEIISIKQFKKIVNRLKKCQFVDLIRGNKKMLRIAKPIFYEKTQDGLRFDNYK